MLMTTRKRAMVTAAKACVVVLVPLLCHAADWPLYRGDAGLSGVSDDAVPDTPVLLWNFKTGDGVKSSPVVAGGKVYAGSADGFLYALDLKTGKQLWTYAVSNAIEAAPLVVSNLVVVGALDGTLHAVTAADGRPVWKYRTDAQIAGAANPIPGTPWLAVGSHDSKVHCIELATGNAVWSYESDSFVNATPAASGKYVVFRGCDAAIHVVDAKSGKGVGKVETESHIAGSAAIRDGHAYVGNYAGEMLAVSLKDRNTMWKYADEKGGRPFFSSPAVDDRHVIVGCRDKQVYCFERATGKILWRFRARRPVDSSPVIAGNRVVVGSDDGRLYILDKADGKMVWSYEIGSAVGTSPAVAHGAIIVGASDGRVYAFGRK